MHISDKKNNAFTLIEALISLLIISLIGLVITTAFSAGIKSLSKGTKRTNDQIKQLQTDTRVRTVAGKVCIPWWENECSISITSNSITFPWQNGLNEEQTVQFPKEITILSYELISTQNKHPIGIKLVCVNRTEEFIIEALFGSFPDGVVTF